MTGLPTQVTSERPDTCQASGSSAPHPRWSPLALWLGGLIVGTLLFHALGTGPLAAPPLDPAGWSAWLAERGTLVATIALLRLVLLALSWYLVGATTIGIVARLARAARLVRVADTLTVPFVRHLLQTALGVSLAAAMVTSAMPAGSLPPPTADRSVMGSGVPLGTTEAAGGPSVASTTGSEARLRAVAGEQPDEVTLERLAPPSRPLPLELLDRARDEAHAKDGEAGVGGAGVGGARAEVRDEPGDEYVVVAGDSLWSIAEAALVDAERAHPGDRAVANYWRVVIDANRHGLTDPENPDLIFPGQVVQLPERPA